MNERGGPQFIPRPEQWSPGRPAPWSGVDTTVALPGLDEARAAFPSHRRGKPSPVASSGASPSAVLALLYPDVPSGRSSEGAGDPTGELHVLLTRRAWGLRTHRGEVSFPGGRCELGETHAEAAMREAWEEIALPPDEVQVLGELDHLTTVTRRAYIVPVVGVVPAPPEVTANPGEVDEVLHVPLRELLDPEVYREERWGDERFARPVYFFELRGDTVWGATAAMLRQMLARLLGVDPGSETDMDPARDAPAGFRLTPEQRRGVV